MRFVLLIIALAFLAMPSLAPGAAAETVIEKVQRAGTIKVAYREDARPFSYLDEAGQPAGFTVDLCRAVIAVLGEKLGVGDIGIDFVEVGAEDRFAAIGTGDADLLCGATTATLSRRALVDFSIPTFFDGASVIFRADGPKSFKDLGGRKIGVRAGTTTEKSLVKSLANRKIEAQIVFVANHADGMARLERGELAAYFADRSILRSLMERSPSPDQLRLSERYFTHEPYALALPKGDSAFRLAIDSALSHIYRSGTIEVIFSQTFGDLVQPSRVLQTLYLVSALPE